MRKAIDIQKDLTEANTELGTVNKRITELKTELRNAKKLEVNPTRLVDEFNRERDDKLSPFSGK